MLSLIIFICILKNKSLKEEISRKEKMLDDDCEIIPVNELKELKNSLLKKQVSYFFNINFKIYY
ncbi:hypothetical protein [Cryptosporidium hominis TU502]|uniref:hypothetical protein n=1 Tax=Cryptosporidium hominis (strain TU502) TaxID=353151 RepID=UPI000045289E|nr:hypothetical protein [Cryptosporidium hominis TU502]